MDAIVGSIISPIVESLLVPVKKHLGFLVSSTKYVKDMNKKIDQLQVTIKNVQDEKNKADAHTEVVPAHAEPWLQEVENLNERRNSIEATGCFNVKKRYTVGKQAYGILKEIKVIEEDKSKIVFTHEKICLAEVRSTPIGSSTSALVPMGTQNNFKSRVSVFNDALQALQSNNESQKMIALCGMAGVGKTTMMEQLKKAVEDSGTFDWVVKVVIGENNDLNLFNKLLQNTVVSV
ncbi:putative P-loop containing nucleoside triphosphate hydrolase [Helianthus annuus]|nr:putative P-loop containing nucleoside triphosphate hydrolase [Helianthus annuus]